MLLPPKNYAFAIYLLSNRCKTALEPLPKNGKIEQISQIYKAKLIKKVQDKRVTIWQ